MEEAWVVSVNMGYGHQRTAFPLKDFAFLGKIINANDYEGIPEKDKKIWENTRKFYEFVSRFSRIPLIGKTAFSIYDRFQKILSFYPKREIAEPNFSLGQIYSLLKKGWGQDLIETLRLRSGQVRPPFISTFFIPAFMAEFFQYPGDIFCIVCDADISRSWAPFNPNQSRIKYFAPTGRVVERLKLYGVKSENIFLTGYPLSLEGINDDRIEILKEDLRRRLVILDPKRKFFEKYKILIEENLGSLPKNSNSPLAIMFSIGGAGAQKEIAMKIAKTLKEKIKKGEIKLIISVGVKKKLKEYFKKENVEILYQEKIEDYFEDFNQKLRETDILWTKPSELSFYAALGIPIIIAPPIGSQEEFNMRWLLKSGFGKEQENLNYLGEWLFDWLQEGYFAECAMEGFIEGEKLGTSKIKEIVKNK